MRLPSLAPYRLRLLFRLAFLLLALATLMLAIYVLQEEKQRSYRTYQANFAKTIEQIVAKLRHPAGQLALLNPSSGRQAVTPLHPLLLPFAAIDFDDQTKVQQAVEMAGCQVQYKDYGSVCVAIGNNPWAGGFIYLAGSFVAGPLQPHPRGVGDLAVAHRIRVQVALRDQQYRWLAPYETLVDVANGSALPNRGRLTGFAESDNGTPLGKPERDFRGWLWQQPDCAQPQQPAGACDRRAFFSIRLPVAVLRDALFRKPLPVWPPADLEQMRVHLQVLAPGDGQVLLDSDSKDATAPFSLADLAPLLLPGETLQIGKADGRPLIALSGSEAQPEDSSRLISRLIRRLPVDGYDAPIQASERISTAVGVYQLQLHGDIRSVNKSLSVVATRVSWFVGAMLAAICLAWLLIEIGIIRRITVLTRRAAAISRSMQGSDGPDHSNLADLRGADELGVLATGLYDLLLRVKDDIAREHIRAEQEKDMWHAVGHEIMSPLQSLLALHGTPDDPSHRYISRMQQAIRVLYGQASPSEAFQSTNLQVGVLDIHAFLLNVAANAPCVGIDRVELSGVDGPLAARADEYSLEDVVTHVLRNADRYRAPGSTIHISLSADESACRIGIRNVGPNIAAELIERIFEYGVSDQQDAAANGNRGQGLFVAKTYMAKMGGTIGASNLADGVEFTLSLQRASSAALEGK